MVKLTAVTTTTFLPPGTPAPPFTLTAVASERQVRLAERSGTPLLLVFVDRHSRDAAPELVKGIRLRYDDHRALPVANVLDLQVVPRLLRGTVKGMMTAALQQARTQIPEPYDPDDHLILLPDWKGEVHQAYRVPDVSEQPALVMIDGHGRIHSNYHGRQPLGAALAAVAQVLNT